MAQLDHYAIKLRNDEVVDEADIYEVRQKNKILEAQIEVYKDKDVDKVRGQMETVLRELTGDGKNTFGGGINKEQF